MESLYILLITAASVFAFVFLIYAIAALNGVSRKHTSERKLAQYYSAESLAKMEYDVSSYTDDDMTSSSGGDNQVTIDEVFSQKHSKRAKSLADLYTPIDDEGLKELSGNYNPDKDC